MFTKNLDNVPSSVMGAAEYAETYYPVIASDMTQGTGLVGIPLGYDSLTLFINIDLFEKAGIDPPETWVELREAAKELTIVEDKIIKQAGVALGLTQNVDHWPEIIALMMIQNGVDLSNPGGKLAEDAIVFYTLFTKKDKVWDISQPPSTIAFASGRLAMYFGPTWRAFEFIRESPELRFRTVLLPQLPKDRPNDPNVAYANYWVEGVWSKSKNKEVAWDFVKYLSSKESLIKFFESASRVRSFGEPYPRVDMADLLIDHPTIGSVIQLAPEAKSWYLVSRTFDGETGINSQINKYFEDAINAVNENSNPENEVKTLVSGVQQILAQYGIR
jgi:ABC-type glycerol-3-phosphate transport system substrate-binding protein